MWSFGASVVVLLETVCGVFGGWNVAPAVHRLESGEQLQLCDLIVW
jgi:hypothetical protein